MLDALDINERGLRVSEVSKMLAVSKWTIRRLIERGELEAIRVGRVLVIMPSALQGFMQKRTL